MRRDRRLAGLVAGLSAVAPLAQARETQIIFAIPEQPREAALIALGQQAGLSLGFAPDARCGGKAGLRGRMNLDAALAHLLEGSSCVALRPDARTVVIRARPSSAAEARPAVAPRPAAPALLGEIVVTADKTESLLSASPYGLTAADGEELQRKGVSNVHDLTLLAAGVTVTNLGPGRDKVLLRGLSDGPLTGHTQSTVGLYLGDLRLTYNAPDPDLPLIDAARVEVLRGPQGSLYGAGSIGGILKVTPNAPDPRDASARLSLGLATTAHGAPTSEAQAVANLPLPWGTSALRVAAWSEVDGGYLDNPRRGLDDTDRTRRRGARVAGLWQVTDDLTLETILIDQTISTRDAHYADPTQGPLRRSAAVAEPHDNDFLALALTARWSPSWGRLTVSLGVLDHDVGTTYDASGAPPQLMAPGAHGATFEDGNEIRGVVGEARLSSVGAGRLHWTIGAFGSLGDQRLDAELTPVEPVAGYDEARRDRLREGAVFGQVSYDVTPTVTLTVGGRAFGSQLRTRSAVSIDGPVRTFAGRTHQGGFAPKLMAAYRPVPGVTVYLQAAEGYRTAGFNTSGPAGQVFGASPGEAQPLRRYGGDQLWNYEAGARWRSADLGLAVRIAAFEARWRDIQADLILPSGLPFTANLGDGASRGVEMEASWSRGSLSLGGNFVLQDPELTRPAAGLPARASNGLPGVPRLSAAMTGSYTWRLPHDRALDLQASYAWVGRSRLAFDATTAPSMGGYSDLRLAATLRSGPTDVRLYVDNALNRRGDTLAFGNPFSFRTNPQETPQRPRTVGLRAALAF